jgi:hypothetical protein
MRPMILIAAMVGSLFMITLSHAANTDKVDTPKANMEQKQSDKEKEKKTKRGDTGSMGEERTGGSGPSGTSGGENVKAPQHEGAGSKKKP